MLAVIAALRDWMVCIRIGCECVWIVDILVVAWWWDAGDISEIGIENPPKLARGISWENDVVVACVVPANRIQN